MKFNTAILRCWLLMVTVFTFGLSQSFAQANSPGVGDGDDKNCLLCDLSINQINLQPFKNCNYGFSVQSGIDAPCRRDHYVWDFGDGNQSSSSSAFALHQFEQAGTYNVCVTIWAELNGTWCSVTQCTTITVTGCINPCSDCNVTVNPPTVVDLTDCRKGFTANVFTNSSNCTRLEGRWDFGDGTVMTTTQTTAQTHEYTVPGVYTVCYTQVMVTPSGQTCETTSCISVDITDCNSQFDCTDCGISINPIQIWNLGNCARGYNASSGMNGSNCTRTDQTWDFGDGTVINTTNAFVFHQYSEDNIYDVCITVNAVHNVTGEMCSAERCTTVVISGCGSATESNNIGAKAGQAGGQAYGISVSPNPIAAGKTLTISVSEAVHGLQLLDVTGRIVLTQEVNGFGDQKIEIPSELSEGIYFVRSAQGEFDPVRIIVLNP